MHWYAFDVHRLLATEVDVEHEGRDVAFVTPWRRIAADAAEFGSDLGGPQLLPREARDGEALIVGLRGIGGALEPLLDAPQIRRDLVQRQERRCGVTGLRGGNKALALLPGVTALIGSREDSAGRTFNMVLP